MIYEENKLLKAAAAQENILFFYIARWDTQSIFVFLIWDH